MFRHNQMSEINFRIVATPSVKSSVWFHPPSSVLELKYQSKSNRFHVSLTSIFTVCNISLSCQNKSNSSSYIFGGVASKSQKKSLSKRVRKAFELYFGCKIEDRDEVLATEIAAAHVHGLWQVCWKLPTYQWLLLFC